MASRIYTDAYDDDDCSWGCWFIVFVVVVCWLILDIMCVMQLLAM